jgi:hypothetical protein
MVADAALPASEIGAVTSWVHPENIAVMVIAKSVNFI